MERSPDYDPAAVSLFSCWKIILIIISHFGLKNHFFGKKFKKNAKKVPDAFFAAQSPGGCRQNRP
jgi:hypothetical protein